MSVADDFTFNIVDSDSQDDVFFAENESRCTQTVNSFVPPGRRIVDIGHLMSTLKSINHSMSGCTFANLEIIKENRYGFKSIFFYKCNMCGILGNFSTESGDLKTNNVNDEAVCGMIAMGAGYS